MQTIVCIIDIDGAVLFANALPLKVADLTKDDVYGKKLWDCYWFNHDPEVQNLLQQCILRAAAGEQVNAEIQGRTATDFMWVAFNIQPVYEGGEIIHLIAEGRDITEQHRLREEAKVAKQYLQGLFDDMRTMVVILDLDGTLTFSNNTPLTLAGLQLEDVLGKKLWDCYWVNYEPEIQALMEDSIQRCAAGENVVLDLQIQTSSGLLWIEFSAHPVLGANGSPVQLLVEGRDISEKQNLHQQAQTEQQQVQSLLDDMRTMVAIMDLDGTVTIVNNTPLQVAGLEKKAVIGYQLWNCPWFTGNTAMQDSVRKDIHAAISGQPTVGDIQILTPEGWIWIEFSVHPVFNAEGKVTRLLAEGRDPSTRRQVEHEREQALLELQQREQNLAITLDSIGDAVITTDAKGLITRMNPIAEQLTGWPFSEAENKALHTIFPIFNALSGEPQDSPIDKMMATGDIIHLSNHTTLRARNGSEYHIADSAAPIRDKNGAILGGILVFSDVTEQYRLREQARATQSQLQGLLDDMQTMVGIFDIDGTMTFVNNTPLLATGYTREDVFGKKLWDCPWFDGHPGSKDKAHTLMVDAAEGRPSQCDVDISTLAGGIWIVMSAHPVFDESDKVIQIVAEARDITDRKNMEDELRSSAQQLKRYRDQAPLATIEWDKQNCVVGWNSAAEKMFGYTFEEVKGQSYQLFFPPTANIPLAKIWDSLISQTGGETLESKIITKDRQLIHTQWHNAPFINQDNKVIGAASIIRDLTDERSAQRSLKNSEQTQRELVDSMVEGIIVTDQSGAILTFNRAAESLLGYTAEEIIGQSVHLLVAGQTEEQFHYGIKRYLETGDVRHIGMGAEIQAVCKNNEAFPTRLAVAELSQNADGKKRFITSFRDLSESKLQEEQLRRSQKMDALGKLTGGIAHDFNNLLGVVTGYAELLENALTNEENLSQYAHEIHHAGERGAKLTRKLLSFSQHTAVTAGSVDINTVISNQQHMLATSLTPRINLIYELSEDAWSISLDSDDLEDAIINICINAMHAIEGNGQIIINTRNMHLDTAYARLKNLPAGDYLLLTITDNGQGMDDETKDRIFDPFFSTKGEQGTGLGLSQVYGFVERSRGAVEVASVLGRGTQFQLYFPRDTSAEDELKGSNNAYESNPGGSETILVVDDEPKLLELCTVVLRQKGYKVLPANNCGEALQLLDSSPVDLLLSDVVMPDMDGYELAAIVTQKYPRVKIQMTSGYSDDRHIATGDDELHRKLIHKPYRAAALLNCIRELLDT